MTVDLRERIREDLTTEMRERDQVTTRLLRTVLSAIADAEAQPSSPRAGLAPSTDSVIAGAAEALRVQAEVLNRYIV